VEDGGGGRIFVRFSDMASYLTDEFFQCWNVYRISEELGSLPFSGGWAEQPEWMVRAILLFKREAALHEQKEFDERRKGS
jgi:hypothetical protein